MAVLLVAGPPTATAQTPSREMSVAPLCGVSDDPRYAFTKELSVQVGGGALYVAARERRYLDALRGPTGQPVRYKRVGTTGLEPDPNPKTIIDIYELTYDGLDKPVTIYVDAYHFDDALRAPMGFTCGAPIALNPPGPDAFLAMDDVMKLAIEQGAARDYAPIPLVASGRPARGVVLDSFRMIARTARAVASAGRPIVLDPRTAPPESVRQRTVVVAFPLACEDRTTAPKTIDIVGDRSMAVPRQGDFATGEALKVLLPGLDIPPLSIAATFNLHAPRPNDTIRITYAEACAGAAEAALLLEHTPARLLKSPMPSVPAGTRPPSRPVRLQAQIDFDGVFQRPSYIGGPAEFVDAAMQAIKGWTVEPTKINGAPISTPVILTVTFGPPER